MKIHDVTVTLRPGLVSWPGEPSPVITPFRRIAKGDSANVSIVTLANHTGTHVDPPVHFFESADGVDRLPLESLVGPCVLVAHEGAAHVTAAWLENAVPSGTERLLIKTRNSERWKTPLAPFDPLFVALDPSAAEWVVERRIRLVGIDYLSIEALDGDERGFPVHTTLLGAGVVVVEGLDLGAVGPGSYELVCAPLKIEAGDGAPARVFLIERA